MAKKLKTIKIKGKEYVTVNERIKYFRENFQGYAIRTDIIKYTDEMVIMKADIITPEGIIVSQGTAFERVNSTQVNQTSHIENCETSAIGRALGNFGIGVDESVASADEVLNAIKAQESVKDKAPRVPNEKDGLMNNVVELMKIHSVNKASLKALIFDNFKKEISNLNDLESKELKVLIDIIPNLNLGEMQNG